MHDKTTDYTIEGWFYLNPITSDYSVFFTSNGTTSAYVDGRIYFEQFRGVKFTRGIHYGAGNTTLFKFSAWNHVAFTYNKNKDE